MNRFQKKCLIVSAAMHGLLFLVLIVGTAFFNSEEKIDSAQIITLVDLATVTDGPTKGGGNPAPAAAPSAAPKAADVVPPAPQPAPPQREPEPQKPIVETQKPKPVEPKKEEAEIPVPKIAKTPTKPVPVSKPVAKVEPRRRDIPDIGKPTIRSTADKKVSNAAAEKAAQKAAADRAALVKNSLNKLGQNLSSSTPIENITGGYGGGGAAEANYDDLVKSKYYAAWFPPSEVSDEEAVVKTRVVITRNGNIISAEIIKGSGNAALDGSIKQALRLKNIGFPFPAGAKDSQRVYIIDFNLKAKRAIG
jgi:TonB family protein